MSTLYTIVSNNGPYRSNHPDIPGASIAYLSHHDSFAREFVAHTDDPSRWTIEPVKNLEFWLEALLQHGFTHVYEHVADTVNHTHEIGFWLTTKRAWRVGRHLHGDSSTTGTEGASPLA